MFHNIKDNTSVSNKFVDKNIFFARDDIQKGIQSTEGDSTGINTKKMERKNTRCDENHPLLYSSSDEFDNCLDDEISDSEQSEVIEEIAGPDTRNSKPYYYYATLDFCYGDDYCPVIHRK